MNTFSENGQVNLELLFQRASRYQAALIEIAKSNTELAGQYTMAMFGARSPADVMAVVSEYTKKGSDLFQQQTKELMELNADTVH